MTKAKVKLSELIEDFDIYPRHSVDSSHVSELARAIQAGEDLPLVIVDKKTKRIVDGFHRTRAWRKVLGRGGEIEADLRSYASEKDLLKEAIERNARQGRKLDQQDRSRSALLLERHGVTVKEIAVTLATTEQRVQELINVRVVFVKPSQDEPDGTVSPPEKQPGKPPAYPQAGNPPPVLTPEQYKVMRSSSGWRTAQTVTQLTRELESGLVDVSAPGLREKLLRLRDVIEAVAEEPTAA